MVLTLHFYEEARSNEGAYIGTLLYKHMTARNVNTVAKLAQLLKSDT
jgi:uncharacterized protein (DUF1697 family)